MSATTPPSSPVSHREAAKCRAPSRVGVVARLEEYKEEERVSLRQTTMAVHARLQAMPLVLPACIDAMRVAEIASTQACIVPCSTIGCRSTVSDVHSMNPDTWVCLECMLQHI